MLSTVALPEELLRAIDRVDQDRAAFLERAARRYLAQLSASTNDADTADKELYERNAERLNSEAADVLEFQTIPE